MATLQSAPNAAKPESRKHDWAMTAWCIIAAFGTYFCMYIFRKPFAASKYDNRTLWPEGYKVLLVNSQLLGYMLSKFLGVKFISELTPQRRIAGIILLIAIAEAALLAFGLVPPPFNIACLFVNGLPLGMVFGMVLAFLEGRRMTELLTAGLCASFILAGGAAKSLGTYLLDWHVPDVWMPFVAGLIAVVPMAFFVWMLAQIPPPSPADVAQRTARVPMDRRQRWKYFQTYAAGLTGLLVMFMLITILRNIRDDYAHEIWSGLLGKEVKTPPEIFTTSEVVVALIVLLINGLCFLIRDSRTAFIVALTIGGVGTMLIAASVAGLHYGHLGGFSFMVLVGIGLYLPYVAVHTTIFERLIAMTRDQGNLGYLMYLADSTGYLGYIVFMMVTRFLDAKTDYLRLFSITSMCMAVVSFAGIIYAAVFFRNVGLPKSEGDARSAA
jgi:hypothetical protein